MSQLLNSYASASSVPPVTTRPSFDQRLCYWHIFLSSLVIEIGLVMEPSCACHDFLRLSLPDTWGRLKEEGRTVLTTPRVCSLHERRRIRESAKVCPLCEKIYDDLLHLYGQEFDVPDEDEENQRFIIMHIGRSSLHDDESRFSCIYPQYKSSEMPFPRRLSQLTFAVWADEGMSPTTYP